MLLIIPLYLVADFSDSLFSDSLLGEAIGRCGGGAHRVVKNGNGLAFRFMAGRG